MTDKAAVSMAVYESVLMRHEAITKRLILIVVVLAVALGLSMKEAK